MLKIPAEYDSNTSPANLTDISRQASLCVAVRLGVSVFFKELWLMNQKWLGLR
jgi:hypothetical protein